MLACAIELAVIRTRTCHNAGAGGDLAYIVACEHITATVKGEQTSYSLRATTVFRREAGEWRVAHRHNDSLRG